MSAGGAEFHEASAGRPPTSEPLAHLSLEVGHFYQRDFALGADHLERHHRRIRAWAQAAREDWAARLPGGRPRVSTCVLVDDYSDTPAPPTQTIPLIRHAAHQVGLRVDYLARESGFADSGQGPGGAALAALVEARLVDDPPPGTTGSRPPAAQTGWVCNGQRSPTPHRAAAMKPAVEWAPPTENAAVEHSIFLDVELWDSPPGGRRWSCAMLAATWQLVRLGLLRDAGARVAVPQPLPDPLPETWGQMPLVTQLNSEAAPFAAYRTLSLLAPQFLPVEHAVRTVLGQVAVDPVLRGMVEARERGEGIDPPAEVVDRVGYVFVDTGPVRGATR